MKKHLLIMFFQAVEGMGLRIEETAHILRLPTEDVYHLERSWEKLNLFPSKIAAEVVAIYAELSEKLRNESLRTWLKDAHPQLGIPVYNLGTSEGRQKLFDYISKHVGK